ncbi:MAG: hypothetical protein ACI4LA_10405 [Emergencia sp.]
MWDKKNIVLGAMFAFFALFCLVSLIRGGRDSYYITGVCVFTVVAVGFLKRARK